MSVTAIRLEMDTEQMQKIFGMQDAYIKKLEQDFQVTIVDRNGSVMITGEEENVSKASRVLRKTDGDGCGLHLPYHQRKADQAQDPGAEGLCGCHPEKHDRIRTGTGRYR